MFAAKDGAGAVEVLSAAAAPLHEGVLVFVAIVDGLQVFGQIVDRAGLVNLPPDVFEIEVASVAQDEWNRGRRLVGAKRVQDCQIALKIVLVAAGCEDVELIGRFVASALFDQRPAGLGGEMTVMEVLDGLFEADGDEEAEDNGGDVDEEVAPGGGGVMGGVYVEYGKLLLASFFPEAMGCCR